LYFSARLLFLSVIGFPAAGELYGRRGGDFAVETIWARIVAWLRLHAPDELENLRPPASNRHFNHLEDTTGLRLPLEMEQSYKVYDGCWVAMFLFGNVYGGVLSSLQAIESDWLRWREVSAECGFEAMAAEPQGPIKPQHWNRGWLPVTDPGNGNCFCVDLDPAPGGVVGQVIWFDRVDGPVRVVANGFAEWLGHHASDLESGRIVCHPTDGFVQRPDAEQGVAADGKC
jgi:cell wall assembly regulator SMI1